MSSGCVRSIGILLGALLLIKLALLAAFGPFTETDSGGYSAYADMILAGGSWLTDAGLAHEAAPLTALRPIGYPAIWALMRLIFGHEAGNGALIVVQIAVSLLATYFVYEIARRLLPEWLALLATVGYALSVQMLYDQSLLSDSLFNSMMVIAFAVPARAVLRRDLDPAKGRDLAIVAACLPLAQAIRAVSMYLVASILPILLLWLGRDWRTRKVAPVGRLCLVAAPLVAFIAATLAWNDMRSGYAFIVTGTTVPIQSMVKAAGRGHPMFDGDTPIDKAAREVLRTYQYSETGDIENRVRRDTRINAVELARLEASLYFRSWAHHPLAMLENGLDNFTPHIAGQFFDFEDELEDSVHIVTGVHIVPPFRELKQRLRQGDPVAALILVATGIPRVYSWTLVALFLVGVPVLWLRALGKRGGPSSEEWVVAAGWFAFVTYLAPLLLLHFALRFTPAVLPWGLIGSLFVARALWLWRANRHGEIAA